jgi:hypothetical protein
VSIWMALLAMALLSRRVDCRSIRLYSATLNPAVRIYNERACAARGVLSIFAISVIGWIRAFSCMG